MFVLERILRVLSEESTKPSFSINSSYQELLLAVEDLRNQTTINNNLKQYHNLLEATVYRFLNKALMELKDGVSVIDSLKIFLFSHDFRIRNEIYEIEIEWINVIRILVEESQFALLTRLVRFLNVNRDDLRKSEAISAAPLLLMNTLNKALNNAATEDRIVSQLLQLIFMLDFGDCDEGFLNETLLKIMRRSSLNDRIKVMALRILKKTLSNDEASRLENIFTEEQIKSSPVLSAALKENFGFFQGIPMTKSSSKVINYYNQNYECFSEIEKFILGHAEPISFEKLSEYEKYLLSLKGELNTNIRDPNVKRDLMRLKLISIDETIKVSIENIEDAEYLALNSRNEKEFWECLKEIPIITPKLTKIEPQKKYLEYFESNHLDSLEDSTVTTKWYYLLCVSKFRSKKYKTDELILLATKFKTHYKDNFDGSGIKFEELEEAMNSKP